MASLTSSLKEFPAGTIFSDDGSKLMVVKSDSVISVYDTKTWKEIRSFEIPRFLGAFLSPCGTYLQTFQKPSSRQDKNVNLWKLETGDSVYQLSQKNMTRTTWPSIRFSSDEAVACHLATNQIEFFDGDFSKSYVNKLRIPGVSAFELSKSPGSYIAAYVSESKTFWDYTEKKLVGATKAEWSVTSEWSPDGRYFLTATTAPRLQIDNRIKIFQHNGKLMYKKNFAAKLYQAEWKPESADKFGDIADLAKSLGSLKVEGSKSSQASANAPAKAPSVQKPAAYRPPHLKSADAVQDKLLGRSPAPEMSKNALKNKKKREKQREKKTAESSG